MRPTNLGPTTLPILVVASTLALAGCSSVEEGTGTEAPSATATVPTNEATFPGGEPGESCGTALTKQQLQDLAGELPPAADSNGQDMEVPWDGVNAAEQAEDYDECLALSWVIYPIEGGTASSPYTIALFNDGQYVQVATEQPYGFFPEVGRDSDEAISVTYSYLKDGDSNADPSGTAVSKFSWNADAQVVERSGELPPQ